MIRRLLILACFATLSATGAFAACAAGFIQISDTLYNPDSTLWNGTISYTLAVGSGTAGTTVLGVQQSVTISGGALSLCLAPGFYSPVNRRSFANPQVITTDWTVPVSGGPYTLSTIQGTIQFVPLTAVSPLAYNPATGALTCAGCGGSGLIQVATTIIHQAQVLTLMSAPVTVLPAPGAGKVNLMTGGVYQVKGSATYNTGDSSLYIDINGNTLQQLSLFAGSSGFATLFVANMAVGSGAYSMDASTYANQPITASTISNPTGTGGDLTVTIYYVTLTLP